MSFHWNLDSPEINRIVDGTSRDPFATLGKHSREGGGASITTLQHGAVAVSVHDRGSGDKIADLEKIDQRGVFSAEVGSDEAYTLRIEWPTGVQETEDPYSFPLLLGDLDLHLIAQGTHYELGRCLGAQTMMVDGVSGVRFAVWAPNAHRVSVVGAFNDWDGRRHPMRLRPQAGVWELFIPRLQPGDLYKFEILTRDGHVLPQKADPIARASEAAPSTASIVASSAPFSWTDQAWIERRRKMQYPQSPISIYEVHAGSWMRVPEEGNRSLTWGELGERLVPYVKDLGFTHVEFMPIAEYPFGGSWGYQPLGLFAPTGRYGKAEDFAALVDRFHAAGIGVIVDWVPAHFPTDVWGLARFDGTALYEHEDPREGFHQDWNTLIYNLGRNEVKGFLIASALEWIERYHIDALRVDAVASMLYRDYSRKAGEWVPNRHGGRENLEAIEFFKHLNSIVAERCPGVLTIAEESTAFPRVTKSPGEGGLGFSLKWNMGWMHDTLHYMERDPVYRTYDHDKMTFGMVYAYSESFVLPLSHDEVVYGKGSMIRKMPGDDWQRFANLRAYYGWMWGFPGKKLLFMGGEIAQWEEWNHESSLSWDLLDWAPHKGVQAAVADLNALYRRTPALHDSDQDPDLFRWAVVDDRANSVFAFERRSHDGSAALVVSNMTPVPRLNYSIVVRRPGSWREVFNSDSSIYGGSNVGNAGMTVAHVDEGRSDIAILTLNLPPLGTVIFVTED